MIHLTERFTNSELFIIGTLNTSDMLAKRTQQLIRDVKPDTVFLQANEQLIIICNVRWATAAEMLQHVKSQDEMNLAKKELKSTTQITWFENAHTTAFKYRWKLFKFLFYGVFSNNICLILALPLNWDPLLPGLEMKFAMEEANKLNSKVVYLGHEFDNQTWQRLYHENRFTLYKFLKSHIKDLTSNFLYEIYEFKSQLHRYGVKKASESTFDQYTINW
jgi:hypothetical protein